MAAPTEPPRARPNMSAVGVPTDDDVRAELRRAAIEAISVLTGAMRLAPDGARVPREAYARSNAAGAVIRAWARTVAKATPGVDPGANEPQDDATYLDRVRAVLASPPPELAAILAELGYSRRAELASGEGTWVGTDT